MGRPLYRRVDFVVFGIILLLSLVPMLVLYREAGTWVKISQFGKVIVTCKRSEDQTICVDGNYPLTVKIKDGKVSVVDAHCADKLCSETGEISRAHGIIVCAPAGVAVYISGEREEVDGLAW